MTGARTLENALKIFPLLEFDLYRLSEFPLLLNTYCTGQYSPTIEIWASAPPYYIEDEIIFEKSASVERILQLYIRTCTYISFGVGHSRTHYSSTTGNYIVVLVLQLLTVPRRPIFDSPQNKKCFFFVVIFSQIGRFRQIIYMRISYTTWLHTVAIHAIQTGAWRYPDAKSRSSDAHYFVKKSARHSKPLIRPVDIKAHLQDLLENSRSLLTHTVSTHRCYTAVHTQPCTRCVCIGHSCP
jgi:hypothetical protein